jgi:hypothetical protein
MSALTDDAGLAASIVAVAAAALGAQRSVTAAYGRTWGSRRDLQRALWLIAPGVTIRHVESLLGPPTYARRLLRTVEQVPGELYESVFVTRHALILALHAQHGGLVGYSVTVTDPRFHPTLAQVPPIARENRPVQLGLTRFGDLDLGSNPRLHRGPYSTHYSEAVNIGRSGMYLTFAFAWNPAGWAAPFDAQYYPDNDGEVEASDHYATERFMEFRRGTVLNTAGVFTIDPDQLEGWALGVDGETTPNLLEPQRGWLYPDSNGTGLRRLLGRPHTRRTTRGELEDTHAQIRGRR